MLVGLKEIALEFLKNNPGVGSVALTAAVLPLAMLWLNNRHNRKLKEKEQQFELEKAEFLKTLDGTASESTLKAEHERLVHASLVKILFEVQKLHIALSGACVDYKCIDEATDRFQASFSKYQEAIADNQMFLSAKVTNMLYRFYQLLGELLIDLKNLKDMKAFDLAVVCVYQSSQSLADSVIGVQDEFNKRRKDVQEEFAKADLSNFRQCCGQQPTQNQQQRFEAAKAKMMGLPEPHQGDFVPA